MIALEDFWYSALKFCEMTRYSWIAFRGKGFPRLLSCPATPPPVRSFFRLAPSMKMLISFGPCAPAEKFLGLIEFALGLMRYSLTLIPGASANSISPRNFSAGAQGPND